MHLLFSFSSKICKKLLSHDRRLHRRSIWSSSCRISIPSGIRSSYRITISSGSGCRVAVPSEIRDGRSILAGIWASPPPAGEPWEIPAERVRISPSRPGSHAIRSPIERETSSTSASPSVRHIAHLLLFLPRILHSYTFREPGALPYNSEKPPCAPWKPVIHHPETQLSCQTWAEIRKWLRYKNLRLRMLETIGFLFCFILKHKDIFQDLFRYKILVCKAFSGVNI